MRIDDSVLKIGDGPGRNMVVHVGEGGVRHLLQRLNRIPHLDAERSDVLVERRNLRVESLHGIADVRRLLLLNLFVNFLVGCALRNDSFVAFNAHRAVVGTWRARFL